MLANVAVYLAVEAADLRGTFDRLAGLTREILQLDPNSGALFLFVNKRKNRVKALWWDKNGYAILYKRLARGTFVLPDLRRGQSAYVEISAADFAQLLAGLPLAGPTAEPPRVVH
jgi:transposase